MLYSLGTIEILVDLFVLNKKVDKTFHGGTNYPKIKKKDIIFNATSPDGPQATSGVP